MRGATTGTEASPTVIDGVSAKLILQYMASLLSLPWEPAFVWFNDSGDGYVVPIACFLTADNQEDKDGRGGQEVSPRKICTLLHLCFKTSQEDKLGHSGSLTSDLIGQ